MKEIADKILAASACLIFSHSAVFSQPNELRPCGSGQNASRCFGPIDERGKLTEDERRMFYEAARLAIDAVSAPEFHEEIDRFRARLERQPDNRRWTLVRATWAPLDNAQIVSMLQAELDGMEVDTFGYLWGTLLWWFPHTKAKDGGSGPVLVNRAALHQASSSTLANTFVHEAAHRIGLRHDRAEHCRSPYALGDIVEAMVDPNVEILCRFEN